MEIWSSPDEDDLEFSWIVDSMNASMCHLVRAVDFYDTTEQWRVDGSARLADWVAERAQMSSELAWELVRVARKLRDLPVIAEMFQKGDLTYAKVVELTKVVTADTDELWAGRAQGFNVASLRDAVRAHRQRNLRDTQVDHEERKLRFNRERGTIWGQFPADQHERIRNAIESGAERIGREQTAPRDTIDQRCADALDELASRAIVDEVDSDAAAVVVHVTLEDLVARRNAWFASGNPLVCETLERLLCDCKVQAVLHQSDGSPIAVVGTSRRHPSRAMRRMLLFRDKGCVFPGCSSQRRLRFHHIQYWSDHGPTSMDNLATLCEFHHRLVHEDGWKLTGNPYTKLIWTRSDGQEHDLLDHRRNWRHRDAAAESNQDW